MSISFIQAADTLQRAYGKDADKVLNTAMRRALRQYAAGERLRFRQDSAGNIYISRRGRDPELADIAIAFPLDAHDSEAPFISAFKVFSELASDDLVCGLTLMGCTSLQGDTVGREIWEASGPFSKRPDFSTPMPFLQQFSGLPSPSDFALSALFEVSESELIPVTFEGSPVLIEKALKYVEVREDAPKSIQPSTRAPFLQVRGNSAACIVRETVREYSTYIAGLFDNFD